MGKVIKSKIYAKSHLLGSTIKASIKYSNKLSDFARRKAKINTGTVQYLNYREI